MRVSVVMVATVVMVVMMSILTSPFPLLLAAFYSYIPHLLLLIFLLLLFPSLSRRSIQNISAELFSVGIYDVCLIFARIKTGGYTGTPRPGATLPLRNFFLYYV